MSKSSFVWYRILLGVLAVVFIFTGWYILSNPTAFALSGLVSSVVGWIAVFYGIMLVIDYFAASRFKSVWSVVAGILLVILGFVIFAHPFESIVPIGAFIGSAFLVAGCYRFFAAFEAKKLGIKSWWAILLLAICSIILAVIMLFNLNNPLETNVLVVVLIGTNLLVDGISDLVTAILGY